MFGYEEYYEQSTIRQQTIKCLSNKSTLYYLSVDDLTEVAKRNADIIQDMKNQYFEFVQNRIRLHSKRKAFKVDKTHE